MLTQRITISSRKYEELSGAFWAKAVLDALSGTRAKPHKRRRDKRDLVTDATGAVVAPTELNHPSPYEPKQGPAPILSTDLPLYRVLSVAV